MRDWSALVHRHLASVRVDERRRREISAELAAHLEAGRHVFVEKPLALTASAATRDTILSSLPGTETFRVPISCP